MNSVKFNKVYSYILEVAASKEATKIDNGFVYNINVAGAAMMQHRMERNDVRLAEVQGIITWTFHYQMKNVFAALSPRMQFLVVELHNLVINAEMEMLGI